MNVDLVKRQLQHALRSKVVTGREVAAIIGMEDEITMSTEEDEGTGVRPALFWVLSQLKHYGYGALIDPSDVCELFGCDDGVINRDTIFAHVQCCKLLASPTGMVSGSREDWIKHAIGIVGQDKVTSWLLEWEE